MNGLLTRRGDINTFSWKQRYFLLEADSNMLSYSVQEGGEMKALLTVTSVFLTHHFSDKKRRCLRIKAHPALRDKAQTRVIIAYAETEDDTDKWFTALQRACCRNETGLVLEQPKPTAPPGKKASVSGDETAAKGAAVQSVKVEYTTMSELSKCSQAELLRMVTNAQEVTLHARKETDRIRDELRESNERAQSCAEKSEQYRLENEKLYQRVKALEKQLLETSAGAGQTAAADASVAADRTHKQVATRPRRRSDAEAVMSMFLGGRMDEKSVGDYLRTLTADDGAALAARISEQTEAVIRGRQSSSGKCCIPP